MRGANLCRLRASAKADFLAEAQSAALCYDKFTQLAILSAIISIWQHISGMNNESSVIERVAEQRNFCRTLSY